MALIGMEWIVAVALAGGGLLVGVLLGRLLFVRPEREKALEGELAQVRGEFADYRAEVESHFRETAAAVNTMTESYRQVHERLREGASRLCGEGEPLLDLKAAPRLAQEVPGEAPDSVEADEPQEQEAAQPEEASVKEGAGTEAPQASDEAESTEPVQAEPESGSAALAETSEPRPPRDYPVEDDAEPPRKLH